MSDPCDCPPFDCAALVVRCLAGDRQASEELYRKFRPLVGAIVTRVLPPQRSDEWDDACQAIFLRLLERLKSWEGRCPFCHWLAVVAARRALDFRRQRHLLQLLDPEAVVDGRTARFDAEAIARLRRRVGGFPAAWRQVWELHLGGVHHDEIGRRVGKGRRTVQYWLAEMREQLRQCLEE
jgi:RNA polymerase sigma-70 factor (ECF subfamily)